MTDYDQVTNYTNYIKDNPPVVAPRNSQNSSRVRTKMTAPHPRIQVAATATGPMSGSNGMPTYVGWRSRDHSG